MCTRTDVADDGDVELGDAAIQLRLCFLQRSISDGFGGLSSGAGDQGRRKGKTRAVAAMRNGGG
jgi:hypothetical protein